MSVASHADPRVSILMVTYKRPQMIGWAIASVCEQTFADWELIIVQDGDNSETGDLLRDWLARDRRIRHFRRGTVGSIAEASNFGLEEARGEYIAILDDDDSWIDPDKLARQVQFLDSHPEYVGCGGGYVVRDERHHEWGRFLKPEHDGEIRARALLANPMANSTTVFRRVVNSKRVLYDAAMRQFADWDFWLTMGARGKLYNLPCYLAHYALWQGGSSFQRQRENGQAALQIVRKHRDDYRGYGAAMATAWLYYGYACLPEGVRRATYGSLSALKKLLASGKPRGLGVGGPGLGS